MHHPTTRAYILPRAFRQRGRLYSGLIEALAQGADPRKLEVEDGEGGWKPYVVVGGPTPEEEEARIARKITKVGRADRGSK